MVWRELLLAGGLLLVPTSIAATSDCSAAGGLSGTCTTGTINNGGVDVSGTGHTPGGGNNSSSGGSSPGGAGNAGGTGDSGVIWKCMEETCDDDTDDGNGSSVPPITLTDIASFRPHPGVQHMQPDGWTVPGLPTNFYAVVSTHVVHGTLLGRDAAVRFTPVAYHWTYGDGKRATRTTKGGTWNALGLHEFDKTPTSHAYRVEGSYTIRLTIDFTAAYQFAGSPFYPIAGVLPLRANDLHITVDGAKTVLVEHDCAANPSGPGC